MIKINKYEMKVTYTVHFFITLWVLVYPFLIPLADIAGTAGRYGSIIIWFILTAMIYKGFLPLILSKGYLLFAFCLVIFLRVFFSGNTSRDFYSPFDLITTFVILITYYCIYLFLVNYNYKYKKVLIVSMISSSVITCLFTLYYLSIDEYAVRRQHSVDYFGLADFNTIYSGIVICGLLLNLLMSKKGNFLFNLISFIVISLTVIKSQYVTAMFLYFIVIFYVLIRKRFKNKMIFNFMIISFIMIVLLLKDNIANIIISISLNSNISDFLKGKLNQVANLLIGNSEDYSRSEVFEASLNTFKNNFLFGVSFENYNIFTIGNHMQWIDDLARYGSVGVIVLFIIYFSTYKYMKRKATNLMDKQLISVAWIFFIILGFFNPNMMGALLATIFCIAPFVSHLAKDKKT